jgi:nitrite reductase/ring-hydroxylating ferredoxin subunit/DMSO/TMAO reductase YedYZ heme-binding membrane subunit
MSARYVAVGWNRSKVVYDAALLIAIGLYILIYVRLGPHLQPAILPQDPPTQAIDAYGTCAFLLLTAALCIGPLARLDRRFAPLAYNRRHFGVLTLAVATGHVWQAIDWYFSYGKLPIAEALLVLDSSFLQLHGFPYIPFGIVAFIVLCALAFTSHDFWLAFLTPPVWKSLHMAIYAAYALVVFHISAGALQGSSNPLFAMVVAAAVMLVCTLHLAAGLRQRHRDAVAGHPTAGGWFDAAAIADIADGAGIVVNLPDADSVAIFRNGDALSAVANRCAHQNGPLGEGHIIDGCITCPWHGYQYRLEDGRAPPPYTEKLATYRLRLAGDRVLLDPRPNPPGTRVEPVRIPEVST